MLKKKIPGLSFVSLVLIACVACSDKSPENEILTSKIQYDVPIVNSDPQLDWWVNNIEGSKREPFLKRIMEAAQNGEIKAYDYFNNPMTPDQVISAGTDTIYRTFLRDYPPYEEYDTMIVSAVSYRDIVKIRFLEEWTWEQGSLKIEKKILAIGPVIMKNIGGDSFNQLLFWISPDENDPIE